MISVQFISVPRHHYWFRVSENVYLHERVLLSWGCLVLVGGIVARFK